MIIIFVHVLEPKSDSNSDSDFDFDNSNSNVKFKLVNQSKLKSQFKFIKHTNNNYLCQNAKIINF